MTMQELDDYIEDKIYENSSFIRFTYYELRIKLNLLKNDTLTFLHLEQAKLKNKGYKVNRTKQEYYYNEQKFVVKDNELLLVAVKE